MPLVAHSSLPAFRSLLEEGRTILPQERAREQDIRELHIGLLNIMPDRALAATERQFLRLLNESNQIVQLYVHVFTLPELERSPEARAYVDAYYESPEEIMRAGLDGLIISGANVTQPALEREAFWRPLQEVMNWAWQNVTSTICSCLATHALLQFKYGQRRRRLPEKLWGVYRHRVCRRQHPLVRGMNTIFDAPHSRFNDVDREQFQAAGLPVLVDSERAGVHMAVTPDGFRAVCFQGHPEYDTISLLKEYKRELRRYGSGERPDLPPLPSNYLSQEARELLQHHLNNAEASPEIAAGLPEVELTELLDNTWRDSAKAVIGNWIGLVYQITDVDRRKPFMPEIDPEDPLALLAQGNRER